MDFHAIDAAPQETSASLTTVYGSYFVNVPQADLTLTELFEDVIEPLILAAGYSPQLIDEAMGRDTQSEPDWDREAAEPDRDEDALDRAAKPLHERYYDSAQAHSNVAAMSLDAVRRAVDEGLDKTRQFNDFMNRVPAPEHAEANRIKPL